MTTITNNKLTDERVSNATLIRLIQWAEQHNSHYVAAALCELQERRKAERGSEPVAWTDAEELSDLKRDGYAAMISLDRKDCEHADPRRQILLFTHPAPARQREQIRREHAEWSDATFGDVGPIGPLKHLSKEALETAAEPDDLSEWADMQFLLWDAQRRAGISDEQITQAMVEKLAVNKQREWPEPKDGEPRLHIKAQPAPVVPEEMPKGLAGQIVSLLAHNIGDKFLAQKIWNACRAALLQGSQPVSNHDELPYAQVKAVADLYALCWQSGEVVTYTPDPEKSTIWLNNYSGTSVQEYVNLERLQEDTKHGLLEVAIARFSKMNEGFPIKRFKADWVISWMLENFPPVAQKQGDN
ncbi:DUF550 domain-containing protein [Salmonella enterica]|uniref:DUF550 domain-containing protein n=1 Tax=Salmonella enterica TaxID=28901 RepID=UPI00215ADB9B|nr:DUF550 domain-containing protein [Salmonella enterica]